VRTGCVDSLANNYASNANTAGTCLYTGCLLANSFNYDSLANSAGTCRLMVPGCTDSEYSDYDAGYNVHTPCAGVRSIPGCATIGDMNYDSLATADDGSCRKYVRGCTDSTSSMYNSRYNTLLAGSCTTDVVGCMDSLHGCFDPSATKSSGCTPAAGQSCAAVPGCTDSLATGYNSQANFDDGTCIYTRVGCAVANALNYDSLVNTPDPALCRNGVTGCTDSVATNFFSAANVDSGACNLAGCMDSVGLNYNPSANTLPAGETALSACTYPAVGCTDTRAVGYNSGAVLDDGSCSFVGCTDSEYLNFDPTATLSSGYFLASNPSANPNGCVAIVRGCTNSYETISYNVNANVDDGSCLPILGCTNPLAPNYNPNANSDDSTCVPVTPGCTDSRAVNYQSEATADAGTCNTLGCIDSTALNYASWAKYQDTSPEGACTPAVPGCTATGAGNYAVTANIDDGTCQFIGCADSTALGFDPIVNVVVTVGAGACTTTVLGCQVLDAINYDSLSNVASNGMCKYTPSPPPPSPTPPPPAATTQVYVIRVVNSGGEAALIAAAASANTGRRQLQSQDWRVYFKQKFADLIGVELSYVAITWEGVVTGGYGVIYAVTPPLGQDVSYVQTVIDNHVAASGAGAEGFFSSFLGVTVSELARGPVEGSLVSTLTGNWVPTSSDTTFQPSAPPSQPPPPAPDDSLPTWIAIFIVMNFVVFLLFVLAFAAFKVISRRKRRTDQVTVIPEVGDRAVVQPPPLPAEPVAPTPAAATTAPPASAEAPAAFVDRVPVAPPQELAESGAAPPPAPAPTAAAAAPEPVPVEPAPAPPAQPPAADPEPPEAPPPVPTEPEPQPEASADPDSAVVEPANSEAELALAPAEAAEDGAVAEPAVGAPPSASAAPAATAEAPAAQDV